LEVEVYTVVLVEVLVEVAELVKLFFVVVEVEVFVVSFD
jgi:hypothetical protein